MNPIHEKLSRSSLSQGLAHLDDTVIGRRVLKWLKRYLWRIIKLLENRSENKSGICNEDSFKAIQFQILHFHYVIFIKLP